MKKRKYTNEEILAGIRAGVPQVLSYIFEQVFPKLVLWIQQKGATREEAQDIFMTSIEAVYKKLLQSEIILENTQFNTYLSQICYNQWLKVYRKKSRKVEVTIGSPEVFRGDITLEETMLKKERYKLYLEKYEQLDENCQKLLEMFLIERKSLREIANYFEYTEKFAKKKKFLCKEKLIQLIKEDPRFKEFEDEA